MLQNTPAIILWLVQLNRNMIKNYVITNIPFIAHRQMAALIIFYGTQCGIIIWSDTIRNPINHKLMSCFLENLMKMLLGKKVNTKVTFLLIVIAQCYNTNAASAFVDFRESDKAFSIWLWYWSSMVSAIGLF